MYLFVFLFRSKSRGNVRALVQNEKNNREKKEKILKAESRQWRRLVYLDDTGLAGVQFTCAGLPKAAASQNREPVLDSDWTGGGTYWFRRHVIGLKWAWDV